MGMIMEKKFRLETPDGKVRIGWVHEQQSRSLRQVIPELEVVEIQQDADFGRTAQREREEANEAARIAAREAGVLRLPRADD